MAVGAGEWRKCCRYCLGDLVVSGLHNGSVGGAGGEEAAKQGGNIGIVPDGFDVGGLEYGEAGVFECLFEALLFRKGEGAGGAGRGWWKQAAEGADGGFRLAIFLVAPDHGDEAAAGSEDPAGFGQGIADVRGVLEGVEASDDIIGFVGEGQVFHFADEEGVSGQAAAGFFDELDGGVETRDEPHFGGHEAQENPGTAADIQQGLLAGQLECGEGIVVTGLTGWFLDGRPVFWLAAPKAGLSSLRSHNGSDLVWVKSGVAESYLFLWKFR
jgi:hypothetical protein